MHPTVLLRVALLTKTAANLLREVKLPAAVTAGTTAGSALLSDDQNFQGDLATGFLAGAGAAAGRGAYRAHRRGREINRLGDAAKSFDELQGVQTQKAQHAQDVVRDHAGKRDADFEDAAFLRRRTTAPAPHEKDLGDAVRDQVSQLRGSERRGAGAELKRRDAQDVEDTAWRAQADAGAEATRIRGEQAGVRGERNRGAAGAAATTAVLAGTGAVLGNQDSEQPKPTPEEIADQTTEGRQWRRAGEFSLDNLVEGGKAAIKGTNLEKVIDEGKRIGTEVVDTAKNFGASKPGDPAAPPAPVATVEPPAPKPEPTEAEMEAMAQRFGAGAADKPETPGKPLVDLTTQGPGLLDRLGAGATAAIDAAKANPGTTAGIAGGVGAVALLAYLMNKKTEERAPRRRVAAA